MGLRLRLHGSIQGVGFRPWVAGLAHTLSLRGRIANAADGVWIDAYGDEDALARFRNLLETPPLAGACVDSSLATRIGDHDAPAGFRIDTSRTRGSGDEHAARVDIAPDLPTCESCLAELDDPSSRRRGYAFNTCAHCGPRYTIVRELPWERRRTSMADFPPCPACAAEFHDPDDRRFHAEAISCPVCGPTLRFEASNVAEQTLGPAALSAARGVLQAGGHLAVLGLGGFHLACDAESEPAVAGLRLRKGRPRKPFAVMVRSLAEAEKLGVIDSEARALLCSDARPIVLVRRRGDAGLAPSLAPGTPMVGLMLAYTPLHALLLEGFGGSLVMTSANRSEEPIPYRTEQAPTELAGLADAILSHDRAIEAPCDDSVALPHPGGAIWLRRSRGRVPRPIALAVPVRRPVLAFGGQWSNTLCVAHHDRAWPSAHIGDLESPASIERFEATTLRWLGWLDVRPELVAHDLHPGYESTRIAKAWPGVRRIAVQHHHAHMASVLGEHGASGPALGLVWDGTGAGWDGAAWGGELLLGDLRSVERVATFRPVALAGGDQAIREPWRIALALLRDAFEDRAPIDALPLFDRVSRSRLHAVSALLAREALCVKAHGVGRYFDAVGALVLHTPTASHQGELAQALGFAASGRPAEPYAFELDRACHPWQIDLRPAIRALTLDIVNGTPPARVSDRFHATLVAAGTAVVTAALGQLDERLLDAGRNDRPRVVLAGGCMQNPLLVDGLMGALRPSVEVLRAMELPPGDGGLAFGQALVAAAIAEDDEAPARPGEED